MRLRTPREWVGMALFVGGLVFVAVVAVVAKTDYPSWGLEIFTVIWPEFLAGTGLALLGSILMERRPPPE